MRSSIVIDVELDEKREPAQIEWKAGEGEGKPQQAKAMMLSLWDGAEKTAMRIELWTNKMMVDEMADFFYQTMMMMADTFQRATRQTELTGDMKDFAKTFHKKFQETQLKEQEARAKENRAE